MKNNVSNLFLGANVIKLRGQYLHAPFFLEKAKYLKMWSIVFYLILSLHTVCTRMSGNKLNPQGRYSPTLQLCLYNIMEKSIFFFNTW